MKCPSVAISLPPSRLLSRSQGEAITDRKFLDRMQFARNGRLLNLFLVAAIKVPVWPSPQYSLDTASVLQHPANHSKELKLITRENVDRITRNQLDCCLLQWRDPRFLVIYLYLHSTDREELWLTISPSSITQPTQTTKSHTIRIISH